MKAGAGTALGSAAVYTPDEVRRLLDATHAGSRRPSPMALRNHALVLLLYRAGLRRSEALDLELGDLRLGREQPVLVVRRSKTERGRRVVGVSPDAAESLRRWLEVRRGYPGTHVFCRIVDPAGTRLQGRYVHALLSRLGARAEVQRAHPHGLRATLAVELVIEGAPLPVVRDVLGHTSISITDQYLRRVFPEMAVTTLTQRGFNLIGCQTASDGEE